LASEIHKFFYSIQFGTVTDFKLAWRFSVSVNLVLVLLQCVAMSYAVVSEECGASFTVQTYRGIMYLGYIDMQTALPHTFRNV
jgi:hypothetical protein